MGLEPTIFRFWFVCIPTLPGLYLHLRLYVKVAAIKSLHLTISGLGSVLPVLGFTEFDCIFNTYFYVKLQFSQGGCFTIKLHQH